METKEDKQQTVFKGDLCGGNCIFENSYMKVYENAETTERIESYYKKQIRYFEKQLSAIIDKYDTVDDCVSLAKSSILDDLAGLCMEMDSEHFSGN
jgi:hypothetical protein